MKTKQPRRPTPLTPQPRPGRREKRDIHKTRKRTSYHLPPSSLGPDDPARVAGGGAREAEDPEHDDGGEGAPDGSGEGDGRDEDSGDRARETRHGEALSGDGEDRLDGAATDAVASCVGDQAGISGSLAGTIWRSSGDRDRDGVGLRRGVSVDRNGDALARMSGVGDGRNSGSR